MSNTNSQAADAPALNVSLPAGSFDAEEVGKLVTAAQKKPAAERQAYFDAEIHNLNKRPDKDAPANLLPGHKVVEVERVLVEGDEVQKEGGKKGETEKVGEVKVVEQVQVFDQKKADEEAEAAEEVVVTPATAPRTDAR